MPRRLSVSVTGAVLASLLALVLHVTFNSPISPLPSLRPSSRITPNNLLKTVDRLGEGRLEGPEAVCVDGEGTLYTATRDGWIKRMQPNGSWEDWKQPGGSALLGIAVSMTGDILVCDADKGLLRVGEDGVATLASEVDGSPIIFADDVVEASDGSVYFSDASTKFGFHDWFLDLLEARPHGRLLRYDPFTKKTYVVLANLTFANGVTLSQDQDFLVVCETWRFRCLKHWLKGEQEGKTEVFIDNLPGGPDNINLAPDGSFWIALLQLRSRWIDWIHCSCMTKRVLATFPKLVEIINPMKSGAMVVNVASNGKITRMLDDSDGTVMSFVTSAMEFDGHLYLGSLQTNFIGKLSLK